MHSPMLQRFSLNILTTRLLRHGCLLLTLMLTLATFGPVARAQLSPAPDGGYPGENTAEGDDALFSLTFGGANTAIGWQALYNNKGGDWNAAIGWAALHANTSGFGNTATGYAALYYNTTGGQNTATGNQTLVNNKTGSNNTAHGFGALYNNTGSNNTAIGSEALEVNSTGIGNTATGGSALNSNTTGFHNTANGARALYNNTTGGGNTAIGRQALSSNKTGSGNTANGFQALLNTTSSRNTALGGSAGMNLTTGSDNIDVGNVGSAGESNTIRIGTAATHRNTFIAGIRGVTTTNANAVPVVIDSAGQLGTISSSRRFKDEIKPMDNSSEALLGLKPVTFHYKTDKQNTPQFGLIAEEVAQVNPDLVVRDEQGEVYTVRYEAVNAMLLNEFLKEHRNVAVQQSTIAELKTTVAQQQKEIEALTATVRKVSERVELSAPAPQIAANED
jgi:uncharacterized coiled-coil protein SlyX